MKWRSQVALAVSNMTSYEEIAALNTKVERTAERYRTLLEINNAMITHLTPRDSAALRLGDSAPRRSSQWGGHHDLQSRERDLPLLRDGEPRFPRIISELGVEFDRKNTISAWVCDHQRAVMRGDLEKEQQYPNDRLAGCRRHPLRLHRSTDCRAARASALSTLGAGRRTNIPKQMWRLLQEVANQVALAVANMQSYEEIVELKARLEKENVYLQEEIRTEHNFEEIIGNSPALLAVLRKVEQVAPTDSTVLIYGETGTGKELIARAIHDRSARKNRPLLKVNCSAISAGLVESELFGHVKGAFTGAFERHVGRFELADGGTIFLDEIGELPLETQVKLLRVLQEREFEPVGSNRPVRVDVRVIAATNRNLQESIRSRRFPIRPFLPPERLPD